MPNFAELIFFNEVNWNDMEEIEQLLLSARV